MPGTATLASNLVNDLVPTVDDVRGLYGELGLNPWRVYRVVRTWSGVRRGDGTASDVATEITPAPRVGWVDAETAKIRYDLPPAGVWEEGEIALTEISLTYTEAELTGLTSTATAEVMYRLDDAQGNGMASRLFNVARPPVPDRNKSIGWTLILKRRKRP